MLLGYIGRPGMQPGSRERGGAARISPRFRLRERSEMGKKKLQ